MTKNELTSVALKFFAIYGIFQLILIVSPLSALSLANAFDKENPWPFYIALLVTILSIAALCMCIWLTWKLSNSIIKQCSDSDQRSDNTPNEILKVILIGMGFYFVATSALSLPHLFIYYLDKGNENPSGRLQQASMVTNAIKLVLGCFLVAKPSQWARAIRSLGQAKSE